MTIAQYKFVLQHFDHCWKLYHRLCMLDGVPLSREERKFIMQSRIDCLECILAGERAILRWGLPEETLTDQVQ